MILISAARCILGQSVEIELPCPNMKIDPRPNSWTDSRNRWVDPDPDDNFNCRFEFLYHENNTTVTVTRVDGAEDQVGPYDFRAYDPATEVVPSFTSTTYTFMGTDGERPPLNIEVLIIHSTVTTIMQHAFIYCRKIKKCFIEDGVRNIKMCAFYGCKAMKVVRLPRTLTWIGNQAFFGCDSLEALYIPPTLERIGKKAFMGCSNIRILPLPFSHGSNVSQIGSGIVIGCDTFFRITQIPPYQHFDYFDGGEVDHNDDYNEEDFDVVSHNIMDFYRRLPPLHKTCLDTYVTSQTINDCINSHGAVASTIDHDGMNPLHIISMNPHAGKETIMTCFRADMNAVLVRDHRRNTPLDYLLEYHGIEHHTEIVVALFWACGYISVASS